MKDRFRKDSRAVIPLELCEEFRKQLLSCAESSLGNNSFQNTGAAATAAGGTTTNASIQQESGPKIFDLSKLNPVEIKNEQLNFQFAIGSVPPGFADEEVSEKSRRWISTSPLVPNTQDGATPKFDPSQQWMPWNDSGSVEIYEPLIPDLIWFLSKFAFPYC
ncbi:unnamed protein product [Dibothriocephalus latus]|uniref:Uncharacterized protein n=1 Tax=Dibothriocephalus latus TaxID=60516 RepID=A0A3P7NE83_DIBLA|nr:unnamed protein product [Dibothriocephalus latus]